ncbi:hypothetical protein [Parapedobacter koreensis]|uniref:Uncharacterized protein n=1 Tax=Parapedobacter koreensis TaxID=332977 RepID=A0A1H7MNV7_9SPHI|nr:hypothetical protein [Parapedobacter koreensis]SEL12781.1 hypothetical protein SAMN05421740_103586 [Parapedobacter koreensis]
MSEILIFKTSVATVTHVQQVASLFKSIESIKHWSFDLEDCDRILRVVASDLQPEIIVRSLIVAGISCEHLDYEL